MPSRGLLFALAGVMVVSCLSGDAVAAGPPPARALGLMSTSGTVLVDQLPVFPSSVLFTGDTITTSKGSAAVVRLKTGATLAINENTELELSSAGGSDDLKIRQGALKINNPDTGPMQVHVLGTTVVVRGQEGNPAVCRIAAIGNRAEIIADSGDAEILGHGRPIYLAQGKFARLEAGIPPGAPQTGRRAGTVNAAIPAETIQRQGQGQALTLKVNDGVDWQDVVQTENTGRVRIQLLDGSVLNVGARSVMRIVEHNPQTQQTQVELTLGKMRSQVVKLTKSGSSFQVKTQTAVIGVVGTIFVVEAESDSTKVTCIEGEVTVQNINPAVQGQVHLNPGETTTVPADAVPSPASAANVADLQTAIERTEIPPGAGGATSGGQIPGVGGGQTGMNLSRAAVPGVSGAGTSITVGTIAGAAAGGFSAVAGITALNKANDANNALSQAITALQNATDAANAATTAITQSHQANPSGSTPCGCGP
jgi:ferric-dicitrate binding protein FerR (iron transport regulator)